LEGKVTLDFKPQRDERRPARRRRVLLGGVVSPTADTPSFECMIRDISERGARLFGRGRSFPAAFYLINIRNRTAHTARVIWTRGAEVGVAFDGSMPISDIKDPALSHLARVWFLHARDRA
jgi:hypothetical protein